MKKKVPFAVDRNVAEKTSPLDVKPLIVLTRESEAQKIVFTIKFPLAGER